MFTRERPFYRVVGNLVFLCGALQTICPAQADLAAVKEAAEERKVEKEFNRLVDWDYAGLQLVDAVSDTDKVNYYNLQHLRRERLENPDRKLTESLERYENHEFRQLYNAVFSTKPPHLRTSEENYIQFLKDEFFAKQRVPEFPKTSRERYEWHVKKKEMSFFGGKYDFETYLAGNFTARRRRRAVVDSGGNKQNPALVQNRGVRRGKRAAGRKSNKVIYQTPRCVDYMNERDLNHHYEDLAVQMKRRFEWGSKETKAKVCYASNESKKNKLYGYNERAIQEKENWKKGDYVNYVADEDYLNKPRMYYHKDDATYKNMPQKKADKMEYEKKFRGPKYHFRRLGFLNHDRRKRNVPLGDTHVKLTTTPMPTWAFVHFKGFSGPYRQNLSAEIIEQVAGGKENAVDRQRALEETGVYKLKDHLEHRTTYRLSTYRNFVEEMATFEPYTFGKDPNDKYPELDEIPDIYLPEACEGVTTPKNYERWVDDQLAEYRMGYRGLTVREPFAHYPQYSWENIGFDLNKIPDPMPPIWPLEKAKFNAKAISEFFGANATETTPVVFDEREWDSMGREKQSLFVPPTKKFYMPGDP